ncbi:hypothetical protein J8F10_24180 [Gemmata sp. G18]|uniref:Translation initiation factor IF-2 N-terminal domain-containing protein n=1 Tax=Gemmata palustris TaxID=2822762 RepID=A0ABS5BX90_9BACT|nr:hypothetical protein [Gemmata palustris]MBP3958359.1 hypothetical protein [Gemmata palustris]
MPKPTGPSPSGTPVNKSDAVRDELAKNPKAGSKEIITALAERGIKVAPSLIYFVKSKANQKKRQAKRDAVAQGMRNSGLTNPVEIIIRVKGLADEVGGMKSLKQLVDLLAE